MHGLTAGSGKGVSSTCEAAHLVHQHPQIHVLLLQGDFAPTVPQPEA